MSAVAEPPAASPPAGVLPEPSGFEPPAAFALTGRAGSEADLLRELTAARERVRLLEAEALALREAVRRSAPAPDASPFMTGPELIARLGGVMEDDPWYAEAAALGAELRRNEACEDGEDLASHVLRRGKAGRT